MVEVGLLSGADEAELSKVALKALWVEIFHD
jgi:hypothetical protein